MIRTRELQSLENRSSGITISRLFEIGIACCESRQPEKAQQAIQTLIDSLDFDYDDISNSFLKLYRSALRLVENGYYSEATSILQALRQTWDESVISQNNVEED